MFKVGSISMERSYRKKKDENKNKISQSLHPLKNNNQISWSIWRLEGSTGLFG